MKRATIEKIIDLETGYSVKAIDFFHQNDEATSFELRRILKESAIDNKPRFVCEICHEPVTICGGPDQKLHFRHHKDRPHCHIKTKNNLSHREIDRRKYNGAKESKPHKEIKEHLYWYLSKEALCSDVHKEKVIAQQKVSGERWWKKPDISAVFKNKEIVIEIQLSTTFLDVIIEREKFYQQKGAYILWVFDERELGQYRFSEKDIFYTHNRNAFIINEASKQQSKETGILHLTCCYQVPVREFGGYVDKWIEKVISIYDLNFDQQNCHLIYSDYQAELTNLTEQVAAEELHCRNEAIKEFEGYWVKERDHDDNWGAAKLDNELLEPLFGYLKHYHIEFPLDHQLSRILCVLFSLKTGKSIGYNTNLLQITNVALHSWREFGVLFVYALDQYGHWNSFKERQSVKDKINNIKEKYIDKQDDQYNELLALFFPEIIERFNTHINKYR